MKLSTSVIFLAGLGVVSGLPTAEALGHIARGLKSARIQAREAVFRTNTTVIDTTWTGVTLLKQGLPTRNSPSNTTSPPTTDVGVEITCKSCYIKGGFTASLNVKDNSTGTNALTRYTNNSDIQKKVRAATQTALTKITDGLQPVSTNSDVTYPDVEATPVQLPTVDVNFDLDLAPVPGVSVQFKFNEGLELYMLVNTKISVGSTYILKLFSSKTPVDLAMGSNITAVVGLDIDLILTSTDAIDVTSGFHLILDKGASMDFDLFSSNVSNVAIPGGQFEFLPVTLVSDSATLTGILRITLKAGFDYSSGTTVLGNAPFDFSAGIVSEVAANLAEFTTVSSPLLSSTDTTCIPVSEAYNLAIGAAAGATIAIGSNTWGPSPASATPLYHTSFTSACALRATPSSATSSPSRSASQSSTIATSDATTTLTTTSTATSTTTTTSPAPAVTEAQLLTARQIDRDAITSTLLSTLAYTGTLCLAPSSANLLGCPASLQSSSVYRTVATHVTVVAPGIVPTFPPVAAAVRGAAVVPVPFGNAAQKVVALEGAPTSFVPTASSTSTARTSSMPTAAATSAVRPAAAPSPPASGTEEDERQKTWLDGKTGGVSNRAVVGVGVGLGVPAIAVVLGGIVYLIRRRSYSRLRSRPGTPSQTVTNNNVYAVFAPPPTRRKS